MVTFLKTAAYLDWLKMQPPKVRAQIDSRLQRIEAHDHYGCVRRLSVVLFEIKFNNGNRIYYTEKVLNTKKVVLILGGNKNGQDEDIRRAQKIAEQIHNG
jgi:putative addiction module killer protein